VTWAKAKTPAASVAVRLVREDESEPFVEEVRGLTDAEGNFTAERVPAGKVVANAGLFGMYVGGPAHYELFERECTKRIVVKPGTTTDVALQLYAEVDVSGIVLDPEGAPIAGASIWMTQGLRYPTCCGQVVATTGRDGRFLVRGTEHGGALAAFAPRYSPSPLHHLNGQDRSIEVELQLRDDGARVFGHVRDEHGGAIDHALVYVAGPYGRGQRMPNGEIVEPPPGFLARSGADGFFDLDGTVLGEVELIVRAADHAPFRRKLTLTAGSPQEIDVELLTGGSLVGEVKDDDGAPLAGIEVRVSPSESAVAWNHREMLSQTSRSDEGGRFRLDHLAALPLEAQIDAEELGTAKLAFEVADGERKEWKAVLSSGLEIRGRVVDEYGKPCVDWRIHSRAQDFESSVEPPPDVFTDSEGAFSVRRCRPTSYELAVREPGREQEAKYFSARVVRDVKPGGDELRIEVPTSARSNAFVVGRFVDDAGQPIDAISLHLCQNNGGSDAVGMNAGGRDGFRIGPIPPGDYYLRTYGAGRPDRILGTKTVPAGGTLDLGTITIPTPGLAEIRVHRADGTPVQDDDVWLWSDDPAGDVGTTHVGDVLRSEPMAPGRWFVCAGHGMASRWIPFDVIAGQTAKLEVTVEPGTLRCFRLVPASGHALPERVDVTLAAIDGHVVWTHAWTRGKADSFEIAQCFARGRHVLSFAGNDGAHGEITFDVDELVDDRQPVDVALH
jgi:hypothetical protein